MTSLRSEVLTLSRTATSLQCGQDVELVKGELSHLNTEVERVRNLTIPSPETMKPNKSETTVICTSSSSLSAICVQSWNYRGIKSGMGYHMCNTWQKKEPTSPCCVSTGSGPTNSMCLNCSRPLVWQPKVNRDI